jgi:glycosyltransferase involved in cell wall biosynthesis
MIIEKKKIAVIGLKGLPAYGGAAAVGENILDQLKEKYDFTVYSVSSHTKYKSGFLNGVYQKVFNRWPIGRLNSLFYYIRSTFHVLFFKKYDLVHLHHSDAAFIIPMLRFRFPVILTTHGAFNITSKWKRYNFYFKLQVKHFVKYANIVTCVSKKEVENFKKYGVNAYYIPNGISKIDVNLFDKGYILFAAGRLIESKGCHLLLQALNLLNYKGKIIIAGDYNQSKEYYEHLKKLSNILDCDFVGLITDKNDLLKLIAGAKLFVYPSMIEAMSMMLLEVASVGTPIVCANIAGNMDIFKTNEVIFFRNGDVKDLSVKIEKALYNLNEIKLMASNLRDRLLKEQEWSNIAIKYDLLYKKILDNYR